jgi:16S rRNA (cytosine967-C5)-methyltransferase
MTVTSRADSNPRLVAARLVHGVVQKGVSLSNLLAAQLGALDDPRQRALAQELAFGTLRWYHRLDAVLGHLLAKPLKHKDTDLHALLLVGFTSSWFSTCPRTRRSAKPWRRCA